MKVPDDLHHKCTITRLMAPIIAVPCYIASPNSLTTRTCYVTTAELYKLNNVGDDPYSCTLRVTSRSFVSLPVDGINICAKIRYRILHRGLEKEPPFLALRVDALVCFKLKSLYYEAKGKRRRCHHTVPPYGLHTSQDCFTSLVL
jgi:hypothetical protein